MLLGSIIQGDESLVKIKPYPKSATEVGSEPVIDQEVIVRAALALLDEVGLEGLTMRRLADKLGIKASSLYWHLRNKQDLLDLLAEEICNPMQEPDRSLPLFAQLEALGLEFRRVLLLHRDAAWLLSSSGEPTGLTRLRLAELMLHILLKAGFEPKDAAYAGLMINDFVTMFVMEETRQSSSKELPAGDDATAGMQNWIETLPKNDYPSLVALAPYLAVTDPEESFRFGLQIIKTGLESYLDRRSDPAP